LISEHSLSGPILPEERSPRFRNAVHLTIKMRIKVRTVIRRYYDDFGDGELPEDHATRDGG
jgi:hypothetical protein